MIRLCNLQIHENIRDLLCLADSKGARNNKNKKKNRRRKDHSKNSSNDVNGDHDKVCSDLVCECWR